MDSDQSSELFYSESKKLKDNIIQKFRNCLKIILKLFLASNLKDKNTYIN